MPIQFQTFTPTDQKHYTLAETQAEKDAALQRAMAQDAANNAAQSANHAMSIDSSNQQHAASLAQNAQQAGVNNDLNQQRLNSDNTQVGLANARAMEKNRADVVQNDIANKRQAFADQNTLQQQGLTNARTAKEDLHKNVAWNRANDWEAKAHDLSNIYSNLQNMSPNKDGFYNLNHAYDSVNAQVYGNLPKGNVQGKLNAQGNMDVYADGKLHLVDGTNSISLPVQAMQQAHEFVTNGGKAPSESDRYKPYSEIDPVTGERIQSLFDTKTQKKVEIAGQPNKELADFNATKETNKNTNTPVVNSDKVNALTGQTPVANTNAPPANAGLGSIYKSVNNGVTTYSNKAMPQTPAQGLASQVTAPAIQAKQPTTNQLLAKEQAQQQSVKAQKVINTLSNKLDKTEAEQAQLDEALQTVRNYRSTANSVQ